MFANCVYMLTISLFFVISGIAHRDLKPENILCESPEKVPGAWFRVSQLTQTQGSHPYFRCKSSAALSASVELTVTDTWKSYPNV